MNKAQKIVAGFLILAAAIILILLALYVKSQAANAAANVTFPSGIVFYYGETCPHCKIVEAFMAENNASSRLNITQKESFGNLVNAQELVSVGSYCKIAKENIGAVPLIYSEGKCYLGDVDAIDFLKAKLNASIR
jgi:hypothetical protein